MLLILSNTPISKHYCLCLNPCLDISTKLKFMLRILQLNITAILTAKVYFTEKFGQSVVVWPCLPVGAGWQVTKIQV